MEFIEIHSRSGQKCLVNILNITHIVKSTVNEKATICFSENDYFETEEDYDQIIELIRQTTE